MRRVVLESPYAGKDALEIARNVHYARACMRDSLLRGEAPIASHLLYTQERILDDALPAERQLGIAAGLAWGVFAEATVVYTDYGISDGMREGIERAEADGRSVEYRQLPSLVALTDGACADRRDGLLSLYNCTGEVADELLSHIESCGGCRLVLDHMFEETARGFQEIARMLKQSGKK